MGSIYGYSCDYASYKNKKRVMKHTKLLKDYVIKKAFEVLGNDYKKVKYRLSYKCFRHNTSRIRYRYKKSTLELLKVTLKIDNQSMTQSVNYGFSNDYYNCRRLIINPLVVGNRKIGRDFIIYHELYHLKSLFFHGVTKHTNLPLFQKETEADRFAIRKILKNEKDKKKAVTVCKSL